MLQKPDCQGNEGNEGAKGINNDIVSIKGCYDSDILAAFDSAVSDGVDVISLSVGGVVVPYYLDAIAIGAFGASDHGVFVSASAGNGGPGGLTVTNIAPWVTTVGAGTIDRDFPDDVHLGNGKIVPGVSVYSGPGLGEPTQLYSLVYAGSEGGDGYSASLCLEGSLDPKTVRGKIVLCDRGINSRAAKGEVVKKAGGVGMILANGVFDGEGLVADCHILPATAVGASVGDEIRKYIITAEKSKSPATATIVFKVTNVGDPNSVYKVSIRPPSRTSVTVQPEKLVFRRVGQKLNFLVRVEAKAVKQLSPGSSNVKSGSIVWSDGGKHVVTSPLVVTMQQPL
ncbi:hypothetical protein LWI28_016971 [Acer negundo]|uniref:Uncharacterized protein n=1 Tax=Acer negundo TaxID=4023 RepID=A0AAD5NJW9_ACENE|nr:hypothetical protein LWI28_016971 [Acer negundo]